MIKKLKRLTAMSALSAVLVGCASMPTEYTSPCACFYEPINTVPIDATDEEKDVA